MAIVFGNGIPMVKASLIVVLSRDLALLAPGEKPNKVLWGGKIMPINLTVGREILSTLQKCKHPVTLRRIAGWHYKKSFSSMYQLIHRLKKAGYIMEVDKGKFAITDDGLKELQRQI